MIARPFTGDCGSFRRTANRHDYAIEPPAPTLCDWISEAGGRVHGIGKIGDIFSRRGISDVRKGSDAALFEHLLALADEAEDGSLTFANFVEFDSLFGHRRDVSGYARALEWFDGMAGTFLGRLRPGDLAIFTADHGNDPTWPGTDHTRERVPVLGYGLGARPVGQVAFVRSRCRGFGCGASRFVHRADDFVSWQGACRPCRKHWRTGSRQAVGKRMASVSARDKSG